MGKSFISCYPLTLITILAILISQSSQGEAQTCTPSGTLTGTEAPADKCDPSGSDCCKEGESYTTYSCSPQVSGATTALLTLNSFEEGGDGGARSKCDEQFHSNDTPVVALSTGWYSSGSRCGLQIVISGNGRSVTATVVDECDSSRGCDEEHAFQPPCRNNIVDGSKAVWDALGVPCSIRVWCCSSLANRNTPVFS